MLFSLFQHLPQIEPLEVRRVNKIGTWVNKNTEIIIIYPGKLADGRRHISGFCLHKGSHFPGEFHASFQALGGSPFLAHWALLVRGWAAARLITTEPDSHLVLCVACDIRGTNSNFGIKWQHLEIRGEITEWSGKKVYLSEIVYVIRGYF